MPPKSSRKRPAADDYDEGDGFVAGEGSEGESGARAGKKTKTAGAVKKSKGSMKSGDAGKYWELSDKRRVTIEEYGGKTLVSIREFYEKDGEMLPGKKGISLSIPQYAALVSHLPALESALSARGELIERPIYTKAGEAEKEVADTDGPGDDHNSDNDSEKRDRGGGNKKNYEATSDSES